MDLPKAYPLEYFMENNEELPEALTQEVRGILAKPLKELEDLGTEIKRFEDHLTQLKVKRAQVQENISRYDCVLSPIRRVPADILHNIFYHCLPTRRNPIMSATEAPLLLTRICRAWRHTAYASPPLWARLYITFSDEDIVSDIEIGYGLSKQYVTETLSLRCNAVEEWLSRSGACPLSISVCYTSRVWTASTDYYPGQSDITSQLFRILARFSSRWTNLELRMPIEVYLKIESMITVAQLPVLDSLRAAFYRQLDNDDGSNDVNVVSLLQAQRLTKISLSAHSSLWRNIDTSSPNPNWTGLTSLSCHWTFTVTEAIFLLKNCPNLEYFTVSLTSNLPQGIVFPDVIPGPISLPHLRALCVIDTIQLNSAINIYDCIDAPRLKWIDYTKQAGYIQHIFGDQNSADPAPITALLQKSTELEKLTIEANNFTNTALLQVFQSASGITHLVFGPESRTDKNSLAPSPFAMSGNAVWNFGDLFSGGEDEEMGNGPASSLLPHLEVLEISQGASTRITDETLLAFTLRRMDPSSQSNTAILKKVAVIFSRAKELDIAEDVYAHADRIGAKIELQLSYLDQVHSRGQHFTSAGYGLDISDRSWQYRDIEEESIDGISPMLKR